MFGVDLVEVLAGVDFFGVIIVSVVVFGAGFVFAGSVRLGLLVEPK
jgi:hypothetical protein